MRDVTREEILSHNTTKPARALIDDALERLVNDRSKRVTDIVVADLTFEELLAALVAAKRELELAESDLN